jgi:hypothetical protein
MFRGKESTEYQFLKFIYTMSSLLRNLEAKATVWL